MEGSIHDLFRNIINKGDVTIFIDDVLVATETKEGHEKIVEEVLKQLEENDLYVKPEKYVWKAREIGFLGVIMGLKVFKMEKEKVKGVTKWPTPQGVKDVQKFLGLENYYRRFVKDFAKITKPLHQLVQKDEKWKWGEEQEKVFRKLKEAFTTELVLVALDLDKEIRIEANALDYMIGGMLSMKYENGRQRPVAFISKLLNETERNYEIHNKEMLVVIHCLEAWRHFLEEAKIKFKIWIDYKNLEYFMTNQKLNQQQARQVLFLSRFDFTLKHVLKSRIVKVDRLSRRPDWYKGAEKDNEDRTLVKPEQLRKVQIEEVLIEGVDILEKIKKSKTKDDKAVKMVEEMKKARVKMLRDEEWREKDRLMLKEGKMYIPEEKGLRMEVIQLYHDIPVEGHEGQQKTVELVTRNFQWPGVMKEIKKCMEGYDLCQWNKN